MAAVNPLMLRLAGEVADGVHVHPLNHPRYLREVVLPNVAAGAAAAGRDPGVVGLTVPVFSAVGERDEDRARWRELARAQVAFYGSTPNYAFLFELLGRPDTTPRIRERQKAGDMAGMAAVVDDELLDHFVVDGTFAELPDLLEQRLGGVAERVVLYFAGLAWTQDRTWFEACGEAARLLAGRSPKNAASSDARGSAAR